MSTDRFHWFDEARFGMFIHWGLYAIPARGEWVMWREKIPVEEYNRLADTFCPPESFSPADWVKLAKESGAKYVVLTTRHHDGFSLYDSKVNSFNSVRTAAGRDFVAEFVEACREHDMRIGLYFSIMSWQHEAIHVGPLDDPEGWQCMVSETHAQVRELMSAYGKIDMLWYDGDMVPGGRDRALHWRSNELNAMVRELQPGIMINDRSDSPEDFSTPEQEITPPPAGRRWESCMTMNNSWGYVERDLNYKSPETVLRCLVRCARYGGNLLLNIGPRPDGSVPEESVERLRGVGEWLGRNGESIYGSQRTTYTEAHHVCGPVTARELNLYQHRISRGGDMLRLDGAAGVVQAEVLGEAGALPILARNGCAADIGGLRPFDGTGPHEVIKLELKNVPRSPATMLGGQFEVALGKGDAPVLAVESAARHQLPEGEIWVGEALASRASDASRPNPAPSEWCPGFVLPVYALTADQACLEFAREVNGVYDLELGVIADEVCDVRLEVNGEELSSQWGLSNPGCPDTIVAEGVALFAGRVSLRLISDCSAGIYALRMRPRWRPLATEHWMTIGPFPTAYEPRQPGKSVLDAMSLEFAPEIEYDPSRQYLGSNGLMLTWAGPGSERGEYDTKGVDFAMRCPDWGKGVCYARTVIASDVAQTIEIAIYVNWWANIFVNGRTIEGSLSASDKADSGAEFTTDKAVAARVHLDKGENVVLVKTHCGRGGTAFAFFLNTPAKDRIDELSNLESSRPGGSH